jgi:hypothetical protein
MNSRLLDWKYGHQTAGTEKKMAVLVRSSISLPDRPTSYFKASFHNSRSYEESKIWS